MKPIYLSTWVVILLSMAACSSTNNTPVQVITPVYTLPAPTNTQAVNPTPSPTATEMAASPTPTEDAAVETQTPQIKNGIVITGTQIVTITIVYDNNPYDPRLTSAWGFSALVEYQGHNLLFDTGGDGQILLENMRLLRIEPAQIDAIVLSHAHDDHTAGLGALLATGVKPVVYLLPSFASSFKHQVEQYTQYLEVAPAQFIAEGIRTTGEIGGAISEQALVIETEQGLVIITGCAHPGIVNMVQQAQQMFDMPIRLVLGGFHLVDKSESEIDAIISDFRQIGVEQVAPCHCTGETAIARFSTVYGDNFIEIGVGSTIYLEGDAIE
jgi:7,8-dihydropterin-6-yl-methyl-4-(beta-D-ribofuranosyl)aminobenzene 5'-phosphate synthase